MFDKMGRARFAVPLVAALVSACVFGLVFYPMANMEMKNLPFAVVSLDEGAQTPQGEMNVGDTLVENITSAAGDEESPIAWTVLGSQEELDEALENNEFYGALIVPQDYTAAQVAAQIAAQADAQAAAQMAAQMAAQAGAEGAAGAEVPADAQAAAQMAAQAGAAGDAAAGASADAQAAAQMAAQASSGDAADAETEAPALTFVLDNAKSPLIAQQMKGSIGSMFEQMGATVDVKVINQGEDGGDASASPMAGMMGQQIGIMPLCMAAMICSILVACVLMPMKKADRRARWKTLGLQAVVLAAATLVAALCAFGMLVLIAGTEAPAGPTILFFWLASLCVALLLTGAFDVAVPLGALVALCVFALGMATGAMPHETLPVFWQDWVVPWAPQNYIGQGLRDILYRGAEAWNAASLPLVVTGAVGACLMAISGFLPASKKPAAN